MEEFFKIKNIIFLGKKKILILLVEYLTKVSVNNDIVKTSINLDNE